MAEKEPRRERPKPVDYTIRVTCKKCGATFKLNRMDKTGREAKIQALTTVLLSRELKPEAYPHKVSCQSGYVENDYRVKLLKSKART